MSKRSEHGSVTVVVAGVTAVVMLLILALGELAVLVVARARAQDVADAVALGGALSDRLAAQEVARANGAELLSWEHRGDVVHVVVRVVRSGEQAAASAHGEQAESPVVVDVAVPLG